MYFIVFSCTLIYRLIIFMFYTVMYCTLILPCTLLHCLYTSILSVLPLAQKSIPSSAIKVTCCSRYNCSFFIDLPGFISLNMPHGVNSYCFIHLIYLSTLYLSSDLYSNVNECLLSINSVLIHAQHEHSESL